MKWKSLSRVRLFATHWLYSPWNSPSQNTGVASLSLLKGFPNTGIKPRSLEFQVYSLPAEPQGKPKEYWSELPISSPADLLNSGIKLGSPVLQADSLPTELWGKPHVSQMIHFIITFLILLKTLIMDLLFLKFLSVMFYFFEYLKLLVNPCPLKSDFTLSTATFLFLEIYQSKVIINISVHAG